MLSRAEFVKSSLELNLFFLRIMKEHLIFAVSALTMKDYNQIPDILNVKNQLEALLGETVLLSDGVIGREACSSGEFITPFTLNAELKTKFYTGIPIATGITQSEAGLVCGRELQYSSEFEQQVSGLNQRVIEVVNTAIALKSKVLSDVLACRMFTHLYPLLLKHVGEEARHYVKVLEMLQRRENMNTIRQVIEQEIFWNGIMGEHAEFIRGMLDPSEKELISKANDFVGEFSELEKEAREAMDKMIEIKRVTAESLKATTGIRKFKDQGTQGILECKIKSVILPLLSDHVLREANHYFRMLNMFKL